MFDSGDTEIMRVRGIRPMTSGVHISNRGPLEGGLRKRGVIYTRAANKPLITVITVVRNGERFLEQTIRSVVEQTYDTMEYIIVDGASTDGTLDIIKKYEHKIAYWISEPDKGIYDAMNKGIDLATGEWINFMNAGDMFYANDVIDKVFAPSERRADVLYGDHHLIYGTNHAKTCKAGEVKDLWKGMIFCHQSSFVKTSLMKEYRFNCKEKIAADFELLYRLALEKHTFHSTGLTIASVSADGLSGTNTLLSVTEQWNVVKRLSNSRLKNFYYIYLIAVRIAKNIVKTILPQSLVNRIRLKL